MYYKKIHGYFNFEFMYDRVISKFNSGSTFVEVGAYLGKSTCYMVEKLLESGKDIKFFVVDSWEGDWSLVEEMKQLGNIYDVFINNMTMAGVLDKINIIRSNSALAANNFDNDSIEFVYIDAAHDEPSVRKDINAWLAKVKPGGIIAGHDYIYRDVRRVVDDVFGRNIEVVLDTWVHYKK